MFRLKEIHNKKSFPDEIKAQAIALRHTNSSAAVIGPTRSSFFTQRVIYVWNNLPMSVEFVSLSAFTQSIGRVSLNQFLTVYKFSVAC